MTFDAKTLSPIGAAFLTLNHSVTMDHTATGVNLHAVVVVLVRKIHAVDPAVTVFYGSEEMESKKRVWLNNLSPARTTHSFLEVFTAPVAAGEAAVEVEISAGTRFSAEYRAVCLTYTNVGRVGNVTAVAGRENSSSMSLTVSSLPGRTVVAAFAHENTTTVTGFSGTHRSALDLLFGISEGVVGEVAGAASVTVSANRWFGAPYCGVAVDLLVHVDSLAAQVAVTGSTPKGAVIPPPVVGDVEIPVLTLAPAFYPMNPQVLRGELFRYPYVQVKVPYVNLPLNAFAAGGVAKLDSYLHKYVGRRILVLGYSEGAQVIYKWIRENGASSDISPFEVTFLCIGNLERKYNGLPDGGDYPGGVGGTGLPDGAHGYRIIDIARQYDFWADHPDDTGNAVAMRNVDPKGTNFGTGSPVHGDYKRVSPNPDHPHNFAVTEDTITYVWAPTYPAPIIDDADFFATAQTLVPRDDVLRSEIEAGYERPVTIPDPPPAGSVDGQFPYGWDGSSWVRITQATVEAPAPVDWWLTEGGS
ncbi:PE-PPE domain-containing protein [Mycolicibacterium austroafricanum]|uniref:PE-PPE domain-containing protein n=1 Tax=Mycolicibacterium austroafricanum TaxID=39687 RepID=UPI001CA313BD|nr:PE-PPE domain-containing protein [Mycolicibacterium austroafricanum]QZT61232.1 PE-PPE domain-containing protein [Mycolicibacterium austroafricanum]